MLTTSTASKWLALLVLAFSLTILASCQTPSTATSDDVCLIWSGISYSAKNDTPETVQGVRVNNAKRQSYCGGSNP